MYGLGPLSETLSHLKREDVSVPLPRGEEEGVGSLVVQCMRLHGGSGTHGSYTVWRQGGTWLIRCMVVKVSDTFRMQL